MYTDTLKLFTSLLLFIRSASAVFHAVANIVNVLKNIPQAGINANQGDPRLRFIEVQRQLQERRHPLLRLYRRLLGINPNPTKSQRLISYIPLILAMFLLVIQLMSDVTPNSKTTFSMIVNCQTIAFYFLVFFLSSTLKKLRAEINYIAAAPKREAL